MEANEALGPIRHLIDRADRLARELDALRDELTAVATEAEAAPVRVITPQLLTPEEAAEALRISRSTVYELIKSGQLDSMRIGTSRRIPVTAITAFVATSTGAA